MIYILFHLVSPKRLGNICLILILGSTAFGIGMAEAILLFRTYALYERSRRLLIFLLVFYSVIYTAVIVILAIFLRSLRYGTPPLPTIKGCYPTAGSIILFGDFVLLILFETVVLVLTIRIGVKRFRHSRNPLITTLYRDGIFNYIYLFFISAGNIIVLVAGPPEMIDLLNTFQRVMHSILSTRVVLHVRSAAKKSAISERSTINVSFSTLQWRDAPPTTITSATNDSRDSS